MSEKREISAVGGAFAIMIGVFIGLILAALMLKYVMLPILGWIL